LTIIEILNIIYNSIKKYRRIALLNKKLLFLILVLATGIAMLTADFLILLFFKHSFSFLLPRLGFPGLGFIIIYSVILGRSAQCFSETFFTNLREDEYLDRLKKIGAVPIKMIGLNVILHALFLGIMFFNNKYLNIDPSIQAALYMASVSFGMLVGTFIYVMSDGMVSHTLISRNLAQYPRDLREKRQEIKACIVPLAVTLVSLLFAVAITLLGINLGGGQGSAASTILVPILVFFFCVVALAIVLKKNSGALYTSVIEELENLSSEQKDLTRRISICSVDELGTIAGMVNAFCEQLGKGIRDIKDGQEGLSDAGIRLEENASGMAGAVTRISSVAELVLGKSQGQKESTVNSSMVIQKITSQIKKLEESISTQTLSMTQASAAVEEMIGNIASITSVTEKMAAQFKTVGQAADEGSRVQKENENRILEIVQQSQSLQEANKIIATIAAATNLLAMNAAIEAAHAGESGQGFSVVADEIRKLAENSSTESKKISTELKQIIETIDHIVQGSKDSAGAFADVSHRINETEKLVYEVDRAIHEQKTGAGQVMGALQVMNDVTSQVKDGSREIIQGNEVMIREIDTLQNSAGEILTSMEEMSGGIKNINSGAQEVSGLAVNTRSSIQKISTIANGFKV
jgi:methyl-accepting chemotaxis protein